VYFFSLDAASALAVIGARTTLGLPYMFARGNERRDGPEIEYELRRRAAGGPACRVRYTVSGPTSTARPGTLDFFLIERYLLHVRRGPSLWTVRVRHPAYPLQHVQLMELQQTLLEADGLPSPPGQLPPLAHFSPGVDVEVFPPTLQFPVCVVR
jgi:uncharacterized protein YqjF (DUF2071 family)